MIFQINLFTGTILLLPILIYIFTKRKQLPKERKIFILVFSIYIIFLLKYAIFPLYIKTDIADVFKSEYSLGEIIRINTNFIPFFSGFNLKDFVLNIIMTFPFGFLIGTLKKDLNFKKACKIGIVLGLGLELCQFLLIFVQGFTFRNININDSIANFLGVIFGYKVYKFIINNLLQEKKILRIIFSVI